MKATKIASARNFLAVLVALANILASVLTRADLLVSAYYEGSVLRYDETSGAYLGTFVTPHSGGLQTPTCFAFGRDGDFYVADGQGNRILRYHGQSGAFLNIFATNGLIYPEGIAVGPEGNLYVANGQASNIVVLDSLTGALIREFGDGVVKGPYGLSFGPDGSLFLADWIAGVLRFDATNGNFLGVFCSSTNFGSTGALDARFGTDGNLYVTDSGNDRVLRFNGTTGVLMGAFASGGGLHIPNFLVVGPDGNLYVVSNNYNGGGTQGVIRYNGATGAFIDQFATNGLNQQFYYGLYGIGFTPRACVSPSLGIVGWWPGDGDANDIIGANNGTLQNGAGFDQGKVDAAFRFDGVDDVVEILSSQAIQNSTNFTIEFWFRPAFTITPADTDSPSLFIKTTEISTDSIGIENGPNGGRLEVRGGPGSRLWSTNSTWLSNTWYHVALSFASDTYRLFINGREEGALVSSHSILNNGNNIRWGGLGFASSASFRGLLDELSLYSRALGANEIAAIYAAGSAGKCKPVCVTPPSGIVAWWPGDGTASDIIGTASGTLQNGATFAPGKSGQSFSFDGVDDYAEAADSAPLRASTTGAITIDLWANFDKVPRTGVLADSMTLLEKNNDYYFAWRADTKELQFALTDNCDGLYHLGFGVDLPSLQPGEWHHYAITAIDGGSSGPTFHFFFDGVEPPWVLEAIDTSCGFFRGTTGNLRLGKRTSTNVGPEPFAGRLDEVTIYSRALSSNEIVATYAAGSAGMCKPVCVPPPAGLVSWWPGDGNANDIVGANHGTFQNSTAFAMGEVGQAFSFDGTDAYVDLGNYSAFRQLTAVTYSFWTKIPSGGGGDAMGAGAVNGQGFGGVFLNSTNFVFYWTPSSPQTDANVAAQNLSIIPNEWTHLAVTIDFANQTRAMYVNGNPLATTVSNYLNQAITGWTPVGNYNSGRTDSIGARFVNSWHYFDGSLDEVTVFNRALSSNEIAAIYAAGSAGLCPTPSYLYWSTVVSGPTNSAIKRSRLDGTRIETLPLQPASGRFGGIAFDVANGHLYSGDGSKLFRANLDGTDRTDLITGFLVTDIELDLVHRKVYWSTGSQIRSANLDGTGNTNLIAVSGTCEGLAVDPVGGKIYYATHNGRIKSAGLDGSTISDFAILASSADEFDVEFDSSLNRVYWNEYARASVSNQKIRWQSADTASGIQTVLAPPPNGLNNGMHFDGVDQKVYFSAHENPARIQRCNADGSGFETVVPATNALVVNYVEVVHSVFTNQPIQFATVVVEANPANAGSVTGGGVYQIGSPVTVTATPNTNTVPNIFVNWTEGGVPQSTNNPYTFTLTRDRQLVADFDLPSYQIAASNNPPGGGTISGAGSFKYGSTNILTAVPKFGYRFANWTEGGTTNGTNASLTTVVYGNHFFVANYAEANLIHNITVSTLPPGLTAIPGTGTYSNGASLAISAPNSLTNDPSYFTFKRFTLNGTNFTNSNVFTKIISTTDPTNMNLVAEYDVRSIRPVAVAASGNLSSPVPATTNFTVTIQFDRNMQTAVEPFLVFTNVASITQAEIPTGGVWLSTTLSNDTYQTPPITFASGMDGTNRLFASQATDLSGQQLSLTNVMSVLVDATPPSVTNILASVTPFSAAITWATDGPSTSEVQFGLTSNYGFSSGLNSSLVSSHSVQLNSLTPGATYHFRVLSRDAAGNTSASGDRVFTTTLAPDLQVTGVTVLPQTNLMSGTEVTVVWTNANTGLGTTTAPWLDQFVVSNLTTSERIFAANVFYDATAQGNLAAGNSRARQFILRLPDGTAGVGQLIFFVTVDFNNTISEFDSSGTAENNNTATTARTSTLAPYPDLVVTDIQVPPTGLPGKPIQIAWTITNQGSFTASGPWTDSLYLSGDSVIGGDQLLTNFAYSVALSPGQSITNIQRVVLPPALLGSRFVVINADSAIRVFEVNRTNNVTISASSIQLVNPDLVVDSVTVPSSAKFGDPIQVVWTVRNVGAAPAVGGWSDGISLSGSSTGAVTLLTLPIIGVSPLDVGETYTRTQTVTLPLNASSIAANYFVSVAADSGDALFELSETNNNAFSGQLALTLPALPDLVVSGIIAPSNGFAGQPVTLIWSVTNQGPVAAVGPWTDTVLLAKDALGSNAQPVVSFSYSNLLNSAASITQTQQVVLSSNAAATMYFVVHVNSSNEVYEGAAENNNVAVSSSPIIVGTPDLFVANIKVPLQALTDRPFQVTWTITNQTAAPAVGNWVDQVFLSADDQPGNDVLLGAFPFSGTLIGHQTTARIQAVSIPRNAVTTGNYHIIVTTDFANTLNEGDANNNNTLVDPTPLLVTRTPLPDLTVESIDTPAVAFSGQTITVRWTVRNSGAASTDASLWNDQIFLSTGPVPDSTSAWGNRVQNVSYLAATDAYIGSVDLRVPITAFGTYYIVVRSDSDNHVLESGETNNVTIKTIEIQLTPPPDLQVTSVQAPGESFSGQIIPVTWAVANLGPGPVLPDHNTWVDTVMLSTNTVLDSSARVLHSQRHVGVLLTNQFYTIQNQNVTLPPNIFGDYYVFVTADSGSEIFEFGYENNNANYDHNPIHITLTPPPDLIVEAVTAPGSGTAGQPMTISWRVLNQGAGDTVASLWYDSVYVSTKAAFDSTATLIGNVYHSGLLAAGGRYSGSVSYTPSVCDSGPFYFFVVSDNYHHVLEFDPSYDAEADNTTRTEGIARINAVPLPDLHVTWLNSPQIGDAGQAIPVSWTVRNSGDAPAFAGGWLDRVYLSRDPIFDPGSAITILSLQHSGSLAAGTNYSVEADALLPPNASGFYYVFVKADAEALVAECSAENNNIAGSLGALYVNPAPAAPPADLRVASVTSPISAQSGQSVTVSWVVTNAGPGIASAGAWQDAIYLMPSAESSAGAIYMGAIVRAGPLPVSSTYQASTTLTLPYQFSGIYYVLVWTDSANQVSEAANENNNSTFAPAPLQVTQAPLPDLQVSSVAAPSFGLEGQNITVDWMVVNTGIGPPAFSSWSDYIYLSPDQVFDSSDVFLGYATHNGVLTNGQSYSQSLSVQLPRGISGPFHLFVCTDARNGVVELDEANNCNYTPQAIQVNLQPLSDLIVTSVAVPASGSPGQPATFVWTVANQGANAASGIWVDSVYISSTQSWDINAAPVGKVSHNGPLQPGQSYTASLTATLPGVVPGQYYAIVRSDILNNVRESNEGNNAGASLQSMPVDVVELMLGQAYPSQLNQGTEQYYKVNVPSNEVLSVKLNGADTNGFNELFTRFGAMPNRGQYDFLYSLPWEPDQQITVPQTKTGFYYHLGRGEFVPNPPTDYTIKAELVPFSITSVSPTHIGDSGQVTIRLKGARFQDGATVQLVSGTNVLSAAKVTVLDSADAKARFYFTNAPNGLYDVVLHNPSIGTATITQAIIIEVALPFSVGVAGAGQLTPRAGISTSIIAGIANSGNVDIPYALVAAGRSGQARWSLRRPAGTFQKGFDASTLRNSGTTVEAIDAPVASFIVRNLEPGDSVPFSLEFPAVSDPSKFFVSVDAMTGSEFVGALQVNVEGLRVALLGAPEIVLPAELQPYLADAMSFWSLFRSVFSETGVADLEALAPAPRLVDDARVPLIAHLGKQARLLNSERCITQCERIETWCEAIEKTLLIRCVFEATTGIGLLDCFAETIYLKLFCHFQDVRCKQICEDYPDCGGLRLYGAMMFGGSLCPQRSSDPNEIRGPAGYGSAAYVNRDSVISYTVYFENVTNATATARQVQVINPLDPNLDPRSVRLTGIGFGDYRLVVPDNRSFYQARVQLGTNFNNLLADVSGGVDIQTGQVRWTLTAIDPATGEPPENPALGLLPPTDTNHVGEGYVAYTVKPQAGTPTGTVITNKASIIFDTNEPIDTNPWWNMVDSGAPSSSIAALPPVALNTSFPVSWSGTDDPGGSGIQNFDIFVSDNGTPFQLWLSGTTDTTAVYQGQPGHTYSFYCIARDNVGNLQSTPASAQAQTTISHDSILLAGNTGCVPLNLLSTEPLASLIFTVNYPADRLTNFTVVPVAPQVGVASIQSIGAGQALVTFSNATGQAIRGPQQIAQICFATISNQLSGFVTLDPTGINGTQTNGAPANNPSVSIDRAVVIANQPLLEASYSSTNRNLSLILYGQAGKSFGIEYRTNLATAASWTLLQRVPMTTTVQVISGIDTSLATGFYRAYEFTATNSILEASRSSAQNLSLLLYGKSGSNYTLESSADLPNVNNWSPVSSVTLTNSFIFLPEIELTNRPTLFIRARQ